ncbi:MAG: hypothetical protein B7Y39_04285 [Bdellovibrio sp. 28-41-41]|nr:MAG: hypothetical protein B7Y39_04285 [Bdellovibrio sp. 28-41-41]
MSTFFAVPELIPLGEVHTHKVTYKVPPDPSPWIFAIVVIGISMLTMVVLFRRKPVKKKKKK